MNRDEARVILSRELAVHRKRSYGELLYLLQDQDTKEVTGPSGKTYCLEFSAVWDDSKKENLRIMGAIDDGGLCAYVPLTNSFITTLEGTSVGEGK